jgi:DHA2 family multidrug resistance protein
MPPATAHSEKSAANRSLITFCVMTATVMQTLDGTIANVALPYMQGSMAASQEEIDWVLTSYIVAAAIMTAPTGFLAARFGRTRVFIVSIVGFTCASVLCGISQSLDQIIISRVLQGVFGAALVPLSQATLLDIYPVEQRGFAMALWTMGALLGPVLGPTLGGWLTEEYSWRWVFYINVPVGIVAAFGLLAFLKETSHSRSVKLDWIGFAALSLAVGAFQTLLDRGDTLDWFSSREIIIEACLAGLAFYIFLVQFSLAPKPFLSRGLFADRNFAVSAILYFVLNLIMYATLALLAPYLQTLMDYPVFTAGVVLAPRGVGSMLAALTCGLLMKKVGVRTLLGIGLIVSAYAQYAMTLWTPNISEWTVISTGFIQGIGVSYLSVPLATTAFLTLPLELRTEAAGIWSLIRNLGSAIGISVTSTLLQINTQVNHAVIAGAVTPFNRSLQTGAASGFWNPNIPDGAAALNQEITRQASIIGYIDDFRLMLILSVIVLPLILLIRSPAQTGLNSLSQE